MITKFHRKSAEDLIRNISENDLKVLDGFQVPLSLDYRLRTSKTHLQKTNHGFFKRRYMVLSQNELYFYADQESEAHYRVVILSPGVFVQQLNVLNINKCDQEVTRVFPIELYVGGSTLGNIGVDSNKCTDPGLITLFFETLED